jgi:hypothetical protein
MLSFFEIPEGVRKRLDFFRSRFFWQSDDHKRKYREGIFRTYVPMNRISEPIEIEPRKVNVHFKKCIFKLKKF